MSGAQPGSSGAAREVAIIGGGPRALYCLERLASHLAGSQKACRVEIFEPTGEFGSGAVYRSGQPAYLRMNFSDRLVDAWPEQESVVPPEERRTFSEWCERHGRVDPCGYSPRSVVGEYLRDCFEAVVAAVPPNLEIVRTREAVEDVFARADGWSISVSGAWRDFDEVMLALGHRPARGEDASGQPSPAPPVVAARYPLSESLRGVGGQPGHPVTVRGMALTFIDVALELTEGRGGSFEQARGAGEAGLRYVPADRDGGVRGNRLVAVSRSGRPLLAKPEPGAVVSAEAVAEAAAPGARRIDELDEHAFLGPLVIQIAETAAELLRVAPPGRDGSVSETVGMGPIRELLLARLGQASGPGIDPDPPAVEHLRRSWRIATGRSAADRWWALGESWRALYPALVERAGHGGVPAADWPHFAILAREMERLAFGPPAINVAKILALADAGLFMPAGPRTADEPAAIDAVLPEPGARERRGDLVDRMLSAGSIRLAPGGRRGIEVDADGSCISAGGPRQPTLAAVGRLTEDWVVGNDTLSRRLHAHPDAWARRVVSA